MRKTKKSEISSPLLSWDRTIPNYGSDESTLRSQGEAHLKEREADLMLSLIFPRDPGPSLAPFLQLNELANVAAVNQRASTYAREYRVSRQLLFISEPLQAGFIEPLIRHCLDSDIDVERLYIAYLIMNSMPYWEHYKTAKLFDPSNYLDLLCYERCSLSFLSSHYKSCTYRVYYPHNC